MGVAPFAVKANKADSHAEPQSTQRKAFEPPSKRRRLVIPAQAGIQRISQRSGHPDPKHVHQKVITRAATRQRSEESQRVTRGCVTHVWVRPTPLSIVASVRIAAPPHRCAPILRRRCCGLPSLCLPTLVTVRDPPPLPLHFLPQFWLPSAHPAAPLENRRPRPIGKKSASHTRAK